MPVVRLRTLTHEYRLALDDGEAARRFAFIAAEPEIAGTALIPVDLSMERQDGFYVARLPDGGTAAGTSGHIMAALQGLAFANVIASAPGAPLIHGATVVGPWGRAVLIGAKTVGKTTFALHLMEQGLCVEGDEHLVVGAGWVMARPRTSRVKERSLPLLPTLADAVRGCPAVIGWDGLPLYAVTPAIAGMPWRIERGQLDHLVFLEANHGGRSVMRPMDRETAFRALLDQSLLPRPSTGGAVARLRTLTATIPAHLLQVGALDGALWHLEQLAPKQPEVAA